MRISPLISWLGAAGLGAVPVALTGWDALSVRRDARAAEMEHERARFQAAELRELIAATPAAHADVTAASELPQRVTQALASCGLSPAVLGSFSGDAASHPSDSLVRRRATMTLGPVTLPQVGKFLESWRILEPAWIVESIELAPAGDAPGGGDLPLRAVIMIECVAPSVSGVRQAGGAG